MTRAVQDSPILFNIGGDCIAALTVAEDGTPHAKPLSEKAVHSILIKDLDWVRTTYGKEDEPEVRPDKPPKEVSAEIVINPPPGIPIVNQIVTTPVFAASGKLLERYGLHADEQIWYHKDETLSLPDVLEEPSKADVAAAVTLFDELFHDFNFVHESDKAHTLAAFLLPFMRRMIKGPTPLHSFEAPMPGSGKGLLTNSLGIVVSGRVPPTCTFTANPEEFRKKLTSTLMEGRNIILLDNIPEGTIFDSADLASVLTSSVWKDRLLGQNKMVTAQNVATWVMTANNPDMSRELARRTIRCRINPETDKPWLRTGFLHDKLDAWVKDNRARFVHGILTMIQSWVVAGKTPSKKRLGSFEDWAAKIGGVLENAGINGFLDDLDEMYAAADSEGEEWRMFFEFILSQDEKSEELDRNHITAGQVADVCAEAGLLTTIMGSGRERARQVRLGNAFKRIRDRVYADHRLVVTRDDKKKGRVYALEPVTVAK